MSILTLTVLKNFCNTKYSIYIEMTVTLTQKLHVREVKTAVRQSKQRIHIPHFSVENTEYIIDSMLAPTTL